MNIFLESFNRENPKPEIEELNGADGMRAIIEYIRGENFILLQGARRSHGLCRRINSGVRDFIKDEELQNVKECYLIQSSPYPNFSAS